MKQLWFLSASTRFFSDRAETLRSTFLLKRSNCATDEKLATLEVYRTS
jgi:hypothetical protein